MIKTVKELSTSELLANEQNEIQLVKDNKRELLFFLNYETKSFNLLATLEGCIMCKVSLDANGRYLTAYYSTDELNSEMLTFDLEKGKQTDFTNVHSKFWKEDKLILEEVAEIHSMYYQYDPNTGSKINF